MSQPTTIYSRLTRIEKKRAKPLLVKGEKLYPSVRAFRFILKPERDKLIEEYAERFGGKRNAEIFLWLWYELVNLIEFWNCECHLFSSENIPVLENTDKKFWAFQQRIMRDGIIMHLSRLTDEVGSGNHERLSVFQVERLFDQAGKERDKELRGLFKRIRKAREPIKECRNDLLAHNDLEFYLNPEHKHSLNGGQVEDLIDLLKKAILLTEKAFGLDDDLGWADHTYNRAERFIRSAKAPN